MRTFSTSPRCARFLGSVLTAALLLCAPAAGQTRSDQEYERLIERLELGMSAVKELGEANVFERLARIADRVREERVVARQGREVERESNDEVREVRRRLKVMRSAVEIFMEAGQEDAAELVERAMHARELALEGRRDPEAARIREGAPNRKQLSDALARAGRLHAERGHPDRSEELQRLSKIFAEQWARRQRAGREGRTEEPREQSAGLQSLEQRVKILDLARRAHAESGNEDAARSLTAAVHYGRLALSGAGNEDLSAAATAVPGLRDLANLLRSAAAAYGAWGNEERAAACAKLAVYYWNRADELNQPGQEAEPERPAEPDRPLPGNLQERADRLDVIRTGIAAYRRFDRADQAEFLERFLHFGELQEAGASPEALSEAGRDLSMGGAIEAMNGAAELYQELGAPDRAEACRALAAFYAGRGGEGDGEAGQEPDAVPEPEPARRPERSSLHQRRQRLEIIQVALAAHAEAGHEEAVGFLERAIGVGLLQESGAPEDAVLQAAEGFSTERLIDLVRRAASLYAESGRADRAQLCADLADYYVGRATRDTPRPRAADESATPDEPLPEAREQVAQQRAADRLAELMNRLRQLEEELAQLEATLRDRERR